MYTRCAVGEQQLANGAGSYVHENRRKESGSFDVQAALQPGLSCPLGSVLGVYAACIVCIPCVLGARFQTERASSSQCGGIPTLVR